MEIDDYGCYYDDDDDDDDDVDFAVQVIAKNEFTDDFDSSFASKFWFISMVEDYDFFSWIVFEELMVLIGGARATSSLLSSF